MDQSSPAVFKQTCKDPSRCLVCFLTLHSRNLLIPYRQCNCASIPRNRPDTILSGKAKVMIAGGFDDISEEDSYEFANMKATSNAGTEFTMGP